MFLQLMVVSIVTLGLFTCSVTAAPQQPLPQELMARKPVNLLPDDLEKSMIFRNEADSTPPATAAWRNEDGVGTVLRVETFNRPKNVDWVDVKYMFREPVKKGDVLLMRLLVRSEYAKQESGEAMFQVAVQQSKPDWARHLLTPLTAGPDWAWIEIPFAAARDADETQGEVHLSFGTIPQAVQVGSIELWNFSDRAKLSDLPQTRFSYRGREADAQWRKDALERIEKTRTAPMNIRVIDAAGAPIPDAKVEVRLVRPAFIWGSEVDSALIVADTPDATKYREMIPQLFDTVVIGNGMKWPKWSGSAASRALQLAAADWIESQNLRMRGHCLVWPGDKFSPKRVQAMPAPRAELSPLIKEHIRDILTQNRGRMVGWDVVNEMIHERDYFKYMPETEAAEWFKVAKETDPSTKLFINDYGMLNSRTSPDTIETYLQIIQRLRDAGAPIDALGVQGHIGRQVRNPTDVLADLDLLAKSGLEIQITEFDINTLDEELQADYTRDFLIALYSHPATTGFTMWGFYQKSHWKPDAAMYRADWSEKPNAKVWRDLVLTKWKTSIDATTDAAGELKTRGHLGDYSFRVSGGGKEARQMRKLTATGADITIQIP